MSNGNKLGTVLVCVYARQWKAVPSVGDFYSPAFKKTKHISISFPSTQMSAQAFGWLKQLPLILSPGSVLWFVGWLVNVHSDHILRNLRQPGESGYKIPTGENP